MKTVVTFPSLNLCHQTKTPQHLLLKLGVCCVTVSFATDTFSSFIVSAMGEPVAQFSSQSQTKLMHLELSTHGTCKSSTVGSHHMWFWCDCVNAVAAMSISLSNILTIQFFDLGPSHAICGCNGPFRVSPAMTAIARAACCWWVSSR